MRVRYQVAFFLIPLLSGCVTRSEIRLFKEKLNNIEKREAEIDSIQRYQTQLLLETRADLYARLDRLDENMAVLQSRLQDNESRIARLSQKLEVFKPESTAQTSELYNTAYLDMVRGDYEVALNGFENYLKLYPSSSLSDNAQYWIGECYYALGKLPEAVNAFKMVVEKYPEGNKIPSALYKLGIIYQKQGDIKKAKEMFQKIIESYPNSSEAKLAKDKLSSIK